MNLLRKMLSILLGSGTEKGVKLSPVELMLTIDRSLDRLTRVGKTTPYCPQCFMEHEVLKPMSFRNSNIVGVTPIRDDMVFKCVPEFKGDIGCYHTKHHGIPMTRKEFREELRLRKGNHWILNPNRNVASRTDKATLLRLRELGYVA